MKNKGKLPKLEKRGKYWEYRLRVSGKLKRFSTNKEDYQEAKKKLEEEIGKHNLFKSKAENKKTKERFLNALHEEAEIEKKTVILLNIEDVLLEWKNHNQDFGDLDEGTKEFYYSIFLKFLNFAFSEDIVDVDQVTNKLAKEYATYLWSNEEDPISAKTFNHHIIFLSQIFSAINAYRPLPEGNPFNPENVRRKKKSELDTASHMPLEPDILQKVLLESAKHGRGFRDLFVIGANTGLRLEDACCLKWEDIGKDFIDTVPGKTKRTGNRARIPISPTLHELINERVKTKENNEFIIPEIAKYYTPTDDNKKKNDDYIKKKCSKIFEDALGDKIAKIPAGEHRKRDTNVYSFRSFRTTFMSLLASKDVSIRSAMRIMAWESAEMIKVYEHELEKARGDADACALQMINSIDELKNELPDILAPELKPTPEALGQLIKNYGNGTIGKIYGMTEAGVRKWLDKFDIVRAKRIESADVSDNEIARIREGLSQ